MRLMKLTGLLICMSMLAVGCSDDDEKDAPGGEPAELYVTVRDASDNYLLKGVDVEFVQNNKVLGIDTTDDTGMALCDNKWDGLVSGEVTVNIDVEGYKPFTKTGIIKGGENEWEVSLTPDKSAAASITVTSENVEDLYGVLSIVMPEKVASVKVSEGSKFDPNDFDEYKNTNYGYGKTTQQITYTNLIPKTKYTFTVASFDDNKRQLETKTISFTTKDWYNKSDSRASIVDYMAIGNGISVTLDGMRDFYLICYEKSKVPTSESEIVREALSGSSKLEKAQIGYVDGLEPGKHYRLYVIPIGRKSTPDYAYQYEAPGVIASIDLSTKDNTNMAAATVIKSASTKTSFDYYFMSSRYVSGYSNSCLSFRGITITDYDQYESLPDIALAVYCLKGEVQRFTAPYTETYTWPGLNLTSWYGIVTLGYSDANGVENSSIITRYKFKYGNYDATTRSAEPVLPAPSTGIRYGAITNDMLKRVHVLK